MVTFFKDKETEKAIKEYAKQIIRLDNKNRESKLETLFSI